MDVAFPPEKQARVIVSTDAKNEADDQFAIVHALLTPSFDLHGIVPAHFGTRRTEKSLRESHAEVHNLAAWNGSVGSGLDSSSPGPQGLGAMDRAPTR